MDVDRARQRDALDRQLLIMHPIGGKSGEQDSDQRDEADDESQANHSVTRKRGVGGSAKALLEVRWEGNGARRKENRTTDICL